MEKMVAYQLYLMCFSSWSSSLQRAHKILHKMPFFFFFFGQMLPSHSTFTNGFRICCDVELQTGLAPKPGDLQYRIGFFTLSGAARFSSTITAPVMFSTPYNDQRSSPPVGRVGAETTSVQTLPALK